jgi:hypothetical protein
MKSSNFINESVFRVNINYVKLQNETKELFFRCLDENRSYEYFKEELEKIWNNVDYKFLQNELEKYEELIHKEDMEVQKEKPAKKSNKLFKLVAVGTIIAVDQKFQKVKEKEYKGSLNSYAYKNDKQEYLKLKVKKYNNQIVPYYSKTTGELVRYVQPSTYNSMIHNTNLTRTGWNTTLQDASEYQRFIIPYHSFSCPHCLEHQNKILTREDVEDIIGTAEEAEGDILHPNCKCQITFYYRGIDVVKPSYDRGELEEQYHIRQKVNTLTLRKEEILTDMKIQKRLGNQDEVDELNQQRNRINSEIRELKKELPTEELQKQVVAISR